MDKKNTSTFSNGLTWGLIIGFASIIFGVITYMADQFTNQWLSYVGIALTIVLLIFGMRSFRDQIRGGIMPFGTAFSFGIIAVLVSSLLSGIFNYILVAVIDPDLTQKVLDFAMEKAMQSARGGATPEMIEEGFGMMSWMFKPVMMSVMTFINGAFMGTIIVLILAAIFKKEEDPSAGLIEAEESSEE